MFWWVWLAWTLLGLAILLALAAELFLRAAFQIKDTIRPLPKVDSRLIAEGYHGADWVVACFEELEHLEADRQPYVDFRIRPVRGQFIEVDPRGRRRTWSPAALRDEPVPEIWMFGGSAAWGFGARDEFTLPSALAKELHGQGRDVRVVNRAQVGHVTTQELIELTLALRNGGRPRVVVFHDGVNDVLSAFQSGRAGLPQNESHRLAEFNILQSPPRLFGSFLMAVARESAFQRLAESAARRLDLVSEGDATLSFDADLAKDVVDVYLRNIHAIDVLSETYKFIPVFSWQPVLFGKNLTDYEAEKARQYAWLKFPIEITNEQIRLVSTTLKRGRFLDNSPLLDDFDQLLFIDFCHTTEDANQIIARALAAEIAPLVVPDEPGVDTP